jgi:hypothetical protein
MTRDLSLQAADSDNTALQSLLASAETGTPAYVLVDPMLGEPLLDIVHLPGCDLGALTHARERVWDRATFTVELAPDTPLDATQFPYLVELEGPTDPWWNTTFELAVRASSSCLTDGVEGDGGGTFPIGAWLISSMRQKDLAESLARLFRVNTEARTSARYLRLLDPRVMAWAGRVVGSARVSASLEGIRHWINLDLLGHVAMLESVGEHASPLRFTRGEWRSMEMGEAVHRSICMAIGLMIAEGTPVTLGLYERAEGALALADHAATRWPDLFKHPRDRQVWAALCLTRGNIGVHPAISQWIDELRDSDPESMLTVRKLGNPLAELTRTPVGTRSAGDVSSTLGRQT